MKKIVLIISYFFCLSLDGALLDQERLNRNLRAAASIGSILDVTELLKEGAQVDDADYRGTALHAACRGGHEHVVALLLENHADTGVKNFEERTALFEAIKSGESSIVNLLVDKKANLEVCVKYCRTPLVYACELKNTEIIKLLIEHNTNINAPAHVGTLPFKTPLWAALNMKMYDNAFLLLSYGASTKGTLWNMYEGNIADKEFLKKMADAKDDFNECLKSLAVSLRKIIIRYFGDSNTYLDGKPGYLL